MTCYEKIAAYYDLLMAAGYYDHDSLARSVQSFVGEGQRILELGVGTGRLCQELIKLDPSCDLTGIDFSASMLDVARKRLPNDVSLVECDVASMDLGCKFDAAVSSGGTWVLIESGDALELGTHLFDPEKDVIGLKNVSDHLKPEAHLLLSIHPPHEDKEIVLDDGIVYSQQIEKKKETSDHYCLEKYYSFRRNGKTLAEETVNLGFYKEVVYEQLLHHAGFVLRERTASEDFLVFEKII